MTSSPLTIRDLARLTNSSKTTVARALNAEYGVSIETRQKIMKVAMEHGYHLDPKVTMLMSHLRQSKQKRRTTNLAWVCHSSITYIPEKTFWMEKIWAGAQQRAQELGFTLDAVIENDREVSPERFKKILLARGIVGIIEEPPYPDSPCAEFDHSPFAVCLLSNAAPNFTFHRTGSHHFYDTGLLLHELLALGYQRPGVLFGTFINDVTSNAIVARFEYEQRHWKPANRIPWKGEGSRTPEGLRAWMHKWKPDVVICCDNGLVQRLKEAGFSVPKDVGVAHINLASDVPDWGGIDQNHHHLGAEAIDILSGQLNHGERGEPTYPKEVLVAGKFVQGKTLIKH